MESCANCKHKEIPGYCYPCCRCDARSEYAAVEKAVEIRTHGDRIRAMSDEELARFLCGLIPAYECDSKCPAFYLCLIGGNGLAKWLKEPYKKGET